MIMSNRKKKKGLVQQSQAEPELIGSTDYIASHEIDQIIKKGRDKIKHAITVSDEKLTKTKKEIVREMAHDLENAGYPINEICDRLSKSLKGLVNDRTVRDALESKYKDQSQSQVAALQNHDGGMFYRQQEQLRKKDIKEFTEEDIKVANPTQLRKVAKHQMQRADWWEQQAKQNEAKAEAEAVPPTTTTTATTTKQDDVGALKQENAELRKKNEELEKFIDEFGKVWQDVQDPNITDEQIARLVRKIVRKAVKQKQEQE